MLQILALTLAQVKGKTSKDLLSEVCQIIFSLHLLKGITKELYKNIMNFKQTQCKMD